jgi:hypothetical protein
MKDYFDLHSLAREDAVSPPLLAQAIAATFTRRKTEVPSDWPPGLTDQFALDSIKRTQWKAYLDKNRLSGPSLVHAVEAIRTMLAETLELARSSTRLS